MNVINMVTIMGRLTAEPELRFTRTNGISVCSFSIAVDRPFHKGVESETDFFKAVAWRGTAEFIQKFYHKGDQILILGALRNNQYTIEGEKSPRITTEIVVKELFYSNAKRKSETETVQQDEETQSLSGIDLTEFEEICSGEDVPF